MFQENGAKIVEMALTASFATVREAQLTFISNWNVNNC